MANKTAKVVNKELDKLEKFYGSKRFREIFRTITNDKGVKVTVT